MNQVWWRSTAVTAGILAMTPQSAFAQAVSNAERYPYGQHMMWWGGEWYGMAFGHLFMILVLAVAIAVAVLMVRWLGGPWHASSHHPGATGRTALDILKERFARGEIDTAEYEERRRVLGE